jgi:hypothetical protein
MLLCSDYLLRGGTQKTTNPKDIGYLFSCATLRLLLLHLIWIKLFPPSILHAFFVKLSRNAMTWAYSCWASPVHRLAHISMEFTLPNKKTLLEIHRLFAFKRLFAFNLLTLFNFESRPCIVWVFSFGHSTTKRCLLRTIGPINYSSAWWSLWC